MWLYLETEPLRRCWGQKALVPRNWCSYEKKDPRDLFLSVFPLRRGHWAHGEKAAAHQSIGEVSWEMELGGTLIFNF